MGSQGVWKARMARAEQELVILRTRVAELESDAARWRYFVKRKTFWRAAQCIQYGGEVPALRPGGPGEYDLKKLSFDSWIDGERKREEEP